MPASGSRAAAADLVSFSELPSDSQSSRQPGPCASIAPIVLQGLAQFLRAAARGRLRLTVLDGLVSIPDQLRRHGGFRRSFQQPERDLPPATALAPAKVNSSTSVPDCSGCTSSSQLPASTPRKSHHRPS
jgi:hypothetical protein